MQPASDESRPRPRLRDEARRVVIACAFVLGSGTFAAFVVPAAIGLAVDYVPVVPVSLATAVGVILLGGVVGLGASRRWYSVVGGTLAGLCAGVVAACVGQAVLWLPADGSLAWGVAALHEAQWKHATTRADGYNPRGKMVFALRLTRTLHGEPRARVRARLGPPDCSSSPDEDAWQIGQWTGFQIDPNCLHVTYDAEGHARGLDVRRPPGRTRERVFAAGMLAPRKPPPPQVQARARARARKRDRRRRPPPHRPSRRVRRRGLPSSGRDASPGLSGRLEEHGDAAPGVDGAGRGVLHHGDAGADSV